MKKGGRVESLHLVFLQDDLKACLKPDSKVLVEKFRVEFVPVGISGVANLSRSMSSKFQLKGDVFVI